MPITIEEKAALDDALAAFEAIDSVALGRLVYDTLLDAKLGPHNGTGMGWKACSTLGRLIKDKSTWDTIQPIEAAVEVSIRMPLVKSTDTVFKSRIATTPPKLPEEHRQTLAHVFGKMDGNELVNLTKLLYQTIVNIEFPSSDALDAFGKFYYSGYSWDELNRSQPIKQSILAPFVNAAHNFLRASLGDVFVIEAGAPIVPEETQESQTEPVQAELPAAHEAPSPATPMPLPEFASAEEIAERAAKDAAKPKFKDGKKKKNGKSAKHEQPEDEAEDGSQPPDVEAKAEAEDSSEADQESPDASGESEETRTTEAVAET